MDYYIIIVKKDIYGYKVESELSLIYRIDKKFYLDTASFIDLEYAFLRFSTKEKAEKVMRLCKKNVISNIITGYEVVKVRTNYKNDDDYQDSTTLTIVNDGKKLSIGKMTEN